MSGTSTSTIVVMGVSGVGKTTLAAQLVERTGWVFAEGDDQHSDETREKMRAGTALTDEDRWPWLRRIAAWIGTQEAAGRSAVVTCSALRRSYRDLLRDGHPSVVFAHLVAPQGALEERLRARRGHYMPPTLLASQLATLEQLQDDEPGGAVQTTGDAASTADEAFRVLGITAMDGGRA